MLAASKQIAEAATSEIERQRPRKQQVPRTISRRWRILEIFTWSCMLSQFAYGVGWEFLEPITLPGWDLMDPKGSN